MSSAHTLPAKVPPPVPAAGGSSALHRFFEDKDWKLYAAAAVSLSLLAGASIYYITRSPSSDSDEPKSAKSKSKKKKFKKKPANKGASASDEKGTIPTRVSA